MSALSNMARARASFIFHPPLSSVSSFVRRSSSKPTSSSVLMTSASLRFFRSGSWKMKPIA